MSSKTHRLRRPVFDPFTLFGVSAPARDRPPFYREAHHNVRKSYEWLCDKYRTAGDVNLPVFRQPLEHAAILLDVHHGEITIETFDDSMPEQERKFAFFVSPDITRAGIIDALDDLYPQIMPLFEAKMTSAQIDQMLETSDEIDLVGDYDELTRTDVSHFVWSSGLSFGARSTDAELYTVIGRLTERAEARKLRIIGDLEEEVFSVLTPTRNES